MKVRKSIFPSAVLAGENKLIPVSVQSDQLLCLPDPVSYTHLNAIRVTAERNPADLKWDAIGAESVSYTHLFVYIYLLNKSFHLGLISTNCIACTSATYDRGNSMVVG